MMQVRRAPARRARPEHLEPRATAPGSKASLRNADSHGLTATFVWASGAGDTPYSACVRVSGRRVDVTGRRDAGDEFRREERVRRIVPNSGPVSLTTRVGGINAGEWSVSAELVRTPPSGPAARNQGRHKPRAARQRLSPGAWSWTRWRAQPSEQVAIRTQWAPMSVLSAAPAVVPGSYFGFIAAGVALALAMQGRLVSQRGVDGGAVLTTSLLAVLAGIVGAKLWYLADRAGRDRSSGAAGWCIQGFLTGAVLALAAGLSVFRLRAGVVLDATTPALFAGLAIGRLGCFFTGCCAGRTSASRWAVWSSDRRVGARRIPTQPLESLVAAGIAIAGFALYRQAPGADTGAVLIAGLSAYTLVRQVLLRFRAAPRKSSARGTLAAVVAGAACVASAGVLAFG